jgi:GNAT superfamily N-acetyltransferase
MSIRATRHADIPDLRAIEWAAGQRFREFGLAHIADDEPSASEAMATYVDEGRSWVATDDADQPVGYVLVDLLDGLAHIEQISVLPEHQGTGRGRALVERVADWARATGRPAMTLTTYDHIPWNRPLYEHLGFGVLELSDLGPELAARRREEAGHGLDPGMRVAMRLDLDV